MVCTHCRQVIPDSASFCPHCGQTVAPAAAYDPQPVCPIEPALRAKSRKKWILPVAVIALLLILMAAGFSTNWFGLTGPAVKIGTAALNTLTADNLTVKITISQQDNYGTLTDVSGNAWMALDLDANELTLYYCQDDGTALAIYEGYAILSAGDYTYAVNIQNQLEELFLILRGELSIDIEELIRTYLGLAVYRALTQRVDLDKAGECALTYLTGYLNNVRWLEENLGYSISSANDTTTYTFHSNLEKILPASLPAFRNCIVSESAYQDLLSEIHANGSKLARMYFSLDLEVSNNQLLHLKFTSWNNTPDITTGEAMSIVLDFTDINRTQIDYSLLQAMLDSARKFG